MATEDLEQRIADLARSLEELTSAMVSQTSTAKKINEDQEKGFKDQQERARKDKELQEKLRKEVQDNLKLKKDENDESRKLKEAKAQIEKEILQEAKENFKNLSAEQKKQVAAAIQAQEQLQREKEKSSKLLESMVNPTKGFENLGKNFDSFNGVVDSSKENLIKMSGGGLLARASFELLAGGIKGVVNSTLAMSKAIASGERGMMVGAKGVTEFTKSIAGAVSTVGSFLMALGGAAMFINPLAGAAMIAAGGAMKMGAAAAETAAELNEFAAKVNDNLYNGFREMGKMSMTTARGMSGLADNIHDMGLTIQEFDKFKTVISNNSKEMNMFGITAGAGVAKFSKTAGELLDSEFGKTLRKMGIDQEEQYEHTAKYMSLQARLGTLQEKNSKQLIQSTNDYIVELDKVAALTGASRKEQEDAREAVLKVDQLSAALMDARKRNDTARVAEIEQGITIAKTLMLIDPRYGKGAAEFYARPGASSGAGYQTSQDAVAFFVMAQKQGLFDKLKQGNLSNTQLDLMTRKAYVGQTLSMAPAIAAGANVGPLAGSASAALREMTVQELREQRIEAEKKRLGTAFNEEKFMKDLEEEVRRSRIATDDLTGNNVEMRDANRKIAIIQEKAAVKYAETVGTWVNSTDTFSKAVDKFAEATGLKGKKPAPAAAAGAAGATSAPTSSGAAAGPIPGYGKPTEEQATQLQKIRDMISSVESKKHGYNALVGGGSAPLTGMTIDEVLKLQRRMVSAGGLTGSGAVGRYQVIPTTLGDVVGKLGLKLDQKFDESTQDRIADFLITNRAGYAQYLRNPTEEGKKRFLQALSRTWRGLPSQPGMQAREKTDEHSNRAGLSWDQAIKSFAGGGFASGPESGYPVMLHGNEVVIPMPNTSNLNDALSSVQKQPLNDVMQQNSTSKDDNSVLQVALDRLTTIQTDMINMMAEKLDMLDSRLARSNDIQKNILNYSVA